MKVKVSAHVDATVLMRATGQATARALKRAGGFTRKVAQNSIRRSGKPSAAGTPPHTRRGRLKKSILYASDGKSVVIGPSTDLISEVGASHEYGLTIVLKKKRKTYKIGTSGPIDVRHAQVIWAHLHTQPQVDRATRIDREVWVEPGRTATYPKRPYMKPALDSVAPKLNEFWKDSIK